MLSLLIRIKENFRTQRLLRHLRPYSAARPVWKKFIDSLSFPTPKTNEPRILIASSTGSHWAMSGFESVLGAALKLRGASVKLCCAFGYCQPVKNVTFGCFRIIALLKKELHLFVEHASPLPRKCFLN